jgi:hypothetical protein
MTRGLALFLWAAVLTTAFAQEGPPDNTDSFDIEPPLLIPNRGDEPLPDAAPSDSKLDLARLQKSVDRAKRDAAGAERLWKIGVLSKVESEQIALRVVRLEADLENARLARLEEEIADKEKQLAAREITKEELAQSQASLTHAIETARIAAVKRQQAEIQAAEANLRRQQKLLALGSARKSDVARAEQKLAQVKALKD